MKSKYYEWTKELLQLGYNYAQIAKIQGRDMHNVRKMCIKTGLTQETNKKEQIKSRAFKRMSQQLNEKGYELIDCTNGVEGIIHIKCKICGAILERKGQVARKPYKIICNNCREECKREKKEAKEGELRYNKIKKQQEKRYLKIKAVSFQTEMSVCKCCGNLFISNKKRKTYCSDKCRNQNKWMMKEGYRNLFPLEEVYRRDNGICYLCGKICDWNDYTDVDGIRVYGNTYPSRDHVNPKSRGGENVWGNIRLAHRICNSIKKDSPLIYSGMA